MRQSHSEVTAATDPEWTLSDGVLGVSVPPVDVHEVIAIEF